jgi:hypothetical protein
MAEEPPASKLKIAIVGHEKNGKSQLAATARKPILFHEFDGREEALAGRQGVYVLPYKDKSWPMQPEAAQDFLTNLSKLEDNLDLHQFSDKIPSGTIVRTNVVDSIQTFGRAFMQYALYGSGDIRREMKVGSYKVFLPKGWDAWNSEMLAVENAILRLLALPCDTIIILHETAEEAVDSTEEKPKYTGRVGVYPVRYSRLLKYFNDVWRVKLTQVVVNNKSVYVPRVLALPNYEFDAASTLTVDPLEEPNIEQMLAKSTNAQNKLQGVSPKALQAGK